MGRLRGIALDVTPLRESREFRLLWAGEGITAAGSQFTRVAVAFQVYELTGSTLMVGLLGLVTMVPLFFGSLLGGAVADHFERRRVILLTQLGGLLCALALALNAAAPNPQTWVIFVVFFLAQSAYAIRCTGEPVGSADARATGAHPFGDRARGDARQHCAR